MTSKVKQPHHIAWLNYHPNRTEQWFCDMIAQGFDIHHIDGNHDNNEPRNLVMIEHCDHMRLHGATMFQGRLGFVSSKGKKKRKRKVTTLTREQAIAQYEEEKAKNWGTSTVNSE